MFLNDAAFRVEHERSWKSGNTAVLDARLVAGNGHGIVDAEFFNKFFDRIRIVVVNDQSKNLQLAFVLFCNSMRSGISARQGPHQLAQKFRRMTLPRESASVTGFPSRVVSLKSGAGSGLRTKRMVGWSSWAGEEEGKKQRNNQVRLNRNAPRF